MQIHNRKQATLYLVFTMLIFGTVGLFRRYIALPSGLLSLGRGVLAAIYLSLFLRKKGLGIYRNISRKSIILLSLSGFIMGINWILLFEAYNHTTIAIATLCFYMQPTIVLLLSPLLFREKLSLRKLLCAAVAILGMTLVSGVFDGGQLPQNNSTGVILGLAAAFFYAAVVVINKKVEPGNAYQKTDIQIIAATITLLPYVLLAEDVRMFQSIDLRSLLLLLIVGIVHTGFAYSLYFGCIEHIKTQSIAIIAYIDPVSALLLSAFVMDEHMSLLGVTGAACIIGAAIVSETERRVEEAEEGAV